MCIARQLEACMCMAFFKIELLGEWPHLGPTVTVDICKLFHIFEALANNSVQSLKNEFTQKKKTVHLK